MDFNFSNNLLSDDCMSDYDELNESENNLEDSGDLNDSFSSSFESESPTGPNNTPKISDTPYLKTPRIRQVNSPYVGNLHFSPHVNTPVIMDRNWNETTPKTPHIPTTKTPEISTMPTPDFSVIESAEYSRRRITRSASNPQIPETPCKRAYTKSRLAHDATNDENTVNQNYSKQQKTNQAPEETSYYGNKFDSFTLIGKGSFSQVYRARNIETNAWYAIKMSNKPINNSNQRKKSYKELQTMQLLNNHPHVLHFVFAWENVVSNTMHIQMELCEQGSLSGFLTKWLEQHVLDPSAYIPEDHIWICLTDTLLGLQYIHSHDVIHLDLKPANIFIANNGFLKIGDFGQSIQDGDDEFTEGDSRYLAPEVLDPGVATKESDIFSLGATILEMTCLIEMPQVGKTWENLRSGNIYSLAIIPNHYSNDLKYMIHLMMDSNYQNRPSAERLLSHPKIQHVINSRKHMPGYLESIAPKQQQPRLSTQNFIEPRCSPPSSLQTKQNQPLLGSNRSRNLIPSFN